MTDVLNQSLSETDPGIQAVLDGELIRQCSTLEVIASEDLVPCAVLQCQGSVLTNKYVEGYPGNHYYGGCENVDVAENLTIERAKSLSEVEYTNVQLHSGARVSTIVLMTLAKPGGRVMGLRLTHGGHLAHGVKINSSGRFYQVAVYGVREDIRLIDVDQVRELALNECPQVIIAGWSVYSRYVDFATFHSIADKVRAHPWTDMARFAGLVTAGLYLSSVLYFDVVSTTIHKTLGGPHSGMVLSRDAETFGKRISSAVFPDQQDGPLIYVVATRVVALELTTGEELRERIPCVLTGTRILAECLMEDDCKAMGTDLSTEGMGAYLVLVGLVKSVLDGQQAEDLLHVVGITVNRNAVSLDPRPPKVTSGLRIDTPASVTRGFGDAEFRRVADIVVSVLVGAAAGGVHSVDMTKHQVRAWALTEAFPPYTGLQ